ASLHPFIADNLAPGATDKTDGWSAYPGAPTRNKRTEEQQRADDALRREVIAMGITPLDVMLEAMRDHWKHGRQAEAVDCAYHAAPYVHPRLNAIDATVKHSVDQREDPIDRLLAEVRRRREAKLLTNGEDQTRH